MSTRNNAGWTAFVQVYPLLPFPEPTWADWRADERRRRSRHCCRFHRSQMIRRRWQRTVASRIKASPPRLGSQCEPPRGAPVPSPSRIPDKYVGATGKRRERGVWPLERNSSAIPNFSKLKLFLSVARKQMLPAPLDPSVSIHGRKVWFSSAAPTSSKLPLTSPLYLVRHFLETTLSFCISNPKPFKHTQTNLGTPALAACHTMRMGIGKMALLL